MSVKLRLMRIGRRGQPFYRIVAVDSRKRRDGAYIEKIGQYNPKGRPAELEIDDEKALKWLQQGAIPSDTVRSLLSRKGILLAWDLQKRGIAGEEINSRVAQFRLEKEAKLREKEQAAMTAAAQKGAVAAAVEPVAEAPAVAATEPQEETTAPEGEAQPSAPPGEAATSAEGNTS